MTLACIGAGEGGCPGGWVDNACSALWEPLPLAQATGNNPFSLHRLCGGLCPCIDHPQQPTLWPASFESFAEAAGNTKLFSHPHS